jgi:hypothetical protein
VPRHTACSSLHRPCARVCPSLLNANALLHAQLTAFHADFAVVILISFASRHARRHGGRVQAQLQVQRRRRHGRVRRPRLDCVLHRLGASAPARYEHFCFVFCRGSCVRPSLAAALVVCTVCQLLQGCGFVPAAASVRFRCTCLGLIARVCRVGSRHPRCAGALPYGSCLRCRFHLDELRGQRNYGRLQGSLCLPIYSSLAAFIFSLLWLMRALAAIRVSSTHRRCLHSCLDQLCLSVFVGTG